jgi:hypothetical protein
MPVLPRCHFTTEQKVALLKRHLVVLFGVNDTAQ